MTAEVSNFVPVKAAGRSAPAPAAAEKPRQSRWAYARSRVRGRARPMLAAASATVRPEPRERRVAEVGERGRPGPWGSPMPALAERWEAVREGPMIAEGDEWHPARIVAWRLLALLGVLVAAAARSVEWLAATPTRQGWTGFVLFACWVLSAAGGPV